MLYVQCILRQNLHCEQPDFCAQNKGTFSRIRYFLVAFLGYKPSLETIQNRIEYANNSSECAYWVHRTPFNFSYWFS